ncbi:MAG: tRNA modification GTPase TrmE [Verrucomicrobiales bacterium]|nr:tRNA modification GTPase TrmE [Verrucomicrobiales bacterium]
MFDDTIAAIATPLGEGGLSIIRISGSHATRVADKVFRAKGKRGVQPSSAASHTIHYGHVLNGEQVIDEVLLGVMRAPRTFTGEDVVEISCHGGMLVTKLVLEAVMAGGARLALPGEFTRRAFLCGRIDLTQAEAVCDLINARTDLAIEAANTQLAGRLGQEINRLRDDLIRLLAHVEAHIDFPDEDIAPDTQAQMLERLNRALEFIARLLSTSQEGQILRKGIRAAIVGRPNAGKSSLLNQLLGHERAIVSPVAGTTRDTIEETANVRGIPVVFIDTAGIRFSEDLVEMEGIRRSKASLEKAELVLVVLNAGDELDREDQALVDSASDKKHLLILNKSDLPRRAELPVSWAAKVIQTDCMSGEGIEAVKEKIEELVWSGKLGSEMSEVMINSRHQNALRRAEEGIRNTAKALSEGLALELAAMDLRIAVHAVGEIVGKTSTEDLLDSIFSQFCIGK